MRVFFGIRGCDKIKTNRQINFIAFTYACDRRNRVIQDFGPPGSAVISVLTSSATVWATKCQKNKKCYKIAKKFILNIIKQLNITHFIIFRLYLLKINKFIINIINYNIFYYIFYSVTWTIGVFECFVCLVRVSGHVQRKSAECHCGGGRRLSPIKAYCYERQSFEALSVRRAFTSQHADDNNNANNATTKSALFSARASTERRVRSALFSPALNTFTHIGNATACARRSNSPFICRSILQFCYFDAHANKLDFVSFRFILYCTWQSNFITGSYS